MIQTIQPAAITSCANSFPEEIRPNSYFYEQLGLETDEEWIRTRTGVRERRVVRADEGETCGTI